MDIKTVFQLTMLVSMETITTISEEKPRREHHELIVKETDSK